MPKHARATVAGLVACALVAGALSATVVQRLDLAGLVAGADVLVEGVCRSAEPVLDRHGLPATRVVVRVARAWRGAKAGEDLAFLVPGGEVGDRGLVIAGMPRFAKDEESILFLTAETHRGIRMPVGLGQGKLLVTRDPATGVKGLLRSTADLELVDPRTGARTRGAASETFVHGDFVAALEAELRRADEAKAKDPKADPKGDGRK